MPEASIICQSGALHTASGSSLNPELSSADRHSRYIMASHSRREPLWYLQMKMEHITVSADVDEKTAKIIEDGLDRFNELHNGPDPTKPLWLICRDEDGNVSGGLKGLVQWDWFFIAMLWVSERKRSHGVGGRLLIEAENAAREHGCTRIRLATMTFQAPEFYKKFGYIEDCRLLDIPPGHSFIWMSKILTA